MKRRVTGTTIPGLAVLIALAGCGGDSPTNPNQPPAAPTSVQATVLSHTGIRVTWVDESDDEDGFKVFRGTSAGEINDLVATVGVDAVVHDDGQLDGATTYHYRVVAFNEHGETPGTAAAFATTRPVPTPFSVVNTFMGSGLQGLGPDGLPPTQTLLYWPIDLTFGPDGRAYVLDWNNHRIRVTDGLTTETLIGTGYLGDAPAGQANQISLNHPTHVSFDSNGFLFVAAWHNSKVLRMNLNTGFIEPVCGDGRRSFGGDGGPATAALVDLPVATAFDAAGRMFIADQANQRVRMVDVNGIITTVVGAGPPAGFAGDGGPATQARLRLPVGQSAQPGGRITFDAPGNLYIADTSNNRIRKIDTNGIITTVAGNGLKGFGGDGGPATAAALNDPRDVAIDADGNLYIADTINNRIRKVDTNGIITTFAGQGGSGGFAGDGGAPLQARFTYPSGLAFDSQGSLYIADMGNNRIRVIQK
jgi:sugar lactone lactonase YvrE